MSRGMQPVDDGFEQPELRQHFLTMLSAKAAHTAELTTAFRRNERLPELQSGPE